MSDNGDDDGETTNQARIYMRTSAADGMNGNDVEVTVEGGEGETIGDINDVARDRFEQAVEESDVDDDDRPELQ